MPPLPNPNAPECPKCAPRRMASNGNAWICTKCGASQPKPDSREKWRAAYRGQKATTPAAPSHVIKRAEPAKRAPGKTIEVDGDTIEITPDGLLVMNGGYPLPASIVEIALWKRIMEEA